MAVLLSGGKPMVARTGRPMASSPANIAPAVVVNPPPTGPTDAQVAQNFVAPLTLGIAIERWRATSLVYQGAAINSSTAYWAYLKSLGFTHVRLVLPWRVSVEMFGGWVNGVQPTDAQLDTFLLAARRAVAAGLRVLYDCTDQLSAADFNANRAAIEQVVDRQAAKIALLGAELPPSMIAVGAYSELDFLTNTDCNEYRTAAHRILRARLATHVLMTGAAKSNSPAMFGGDWLMVPDTRVLLKWHDFPGVPTASYIQNVRSTMETMASAVGGVGIVGGQVAEGTTGYDDGWAKLVSLYANYWPQGRPTYWCATDGNWYNWCNSVTDASIRAPLVSVTAYASAKIMNDAAWKAANPGVTPPTVPADPTAAPTLPPPTTSPGSGSILINGRVVAGPGSQVFEDFNNGQGIFVQFWHAAGPTLSIQNSIARIDNYPGADNYSDGNVNDNGAGLFTHPNHQPQDGWGYGFFAFKVRHFGGLGWNNPRAYAQGSATVLWPGSDEWPGAETDLGEIDGGGKLYYAVHWKSGAYTLDQNGHKNYRDDYRLLYVPAPNDTDWSNWHVHMCEWGPGYFRVFIDSKEFAYVDTNSLPVDTNETSRAWQFADYAHGGQNKPAGFMLRARDVAIECDWFSWNPL
jgi:hypothetical protein